MVNRGEEKVWVQMNVVPRSTGWRSLLEKNCVAIYLRSTPLDETLLLVLLIAIKASCFVAGGSFSSWLRIILVV